MTDLTAPNLSTDPADDMGGASISPQLKDVSLPPEDRDGWDGITKPKQRQGGPRFLTDVIVELGLCDADRVEQAIATARTSGTTPEQELWPRARSAMTTSPVRWPSAMAWSTSTSRRSRSTWRRPA